MILNFFSKIIFLVKIELFLFHHTKVQHKTYIRVQRREYSNTQHKAKPSLIPEKLFIFLPSVSILGFAINCRR